MAWNDEPATVSSISSTSASKSNIKVQYEAFKLKQQLHQTVTAHDKGILVKSASDGSGFYLLHSVPKYPNIDRIKAAIDPVTPQGSSYG